MPKKRALADAYAEAVADLQKRIYRPIYILTGDEPYYIDRLADHIAEHVLDEPERAFNLVVLYGKDVNVPNIIEAARRFPMMASHQVVIVREAQLIKNLGDLEVYLKAPQPSTLLVICHKLAASATPPKPSDKLRKMFAQAARVGVLFESKRLYDYQLPEWISAYLAPKGIRIGPGPAELLADYLGADLCRVAHELDKLLITLPPHTPAITAEHIELNIGISKEFNRFELTKAVGQRDALRAFRIADYFARNPSANPLVLTITALFQYFHKLFRYHFLSDKSDRNAAAALGVHPYFLTEYRMAARAFPPRRCVEAFGLLREYDMRSKGLNNESTDDGELLKELIYKLIR